MTLTPVQLTRPASVTDAFLRQLVARVPGGSPWRLTEVYTGKLLVELPQSTPSDVEQAFAKSRASGPTRSSSTTPARSPTSSRWRAARTG
jgi:succinate-semialdehyde dehydrogenase/glutarate-semialdehyde dehydrogenase